MSIGCDTPVFLTSPPPPVVLKSAAAASFAERHLRSIVSDQRKKLTEKFFPKVSEEMDDFTASSTMNNTTPLTKRPFLSNQVHLSSVSCEATKLGMQTRSRRFTHEAFKGRVSGDIKNRGDSLIRAKKIVTDPDYPSKELVDKLSRLFLNDSLSADNLQD